MTPETLFDLADRLDEIAAWYDDGDFPVTARSTKQLADTFRADAHLIVRADYPPPVTNHDHTPGKDLHDGLW